MDKIIYRIFLIFITSALLFIYVFPWNLYNIDMPYSMKDYKLGLDLQGGIELDYKVELSDVKKDKDFSASKQKDIIEGLKSIIDKRVETLKISDSVITSADYAGEQHIIVQIPLKGNNSLENTDNIKKAKDAIGKVVKIEFKEARGKITSDDVKERKIVAESGLNEALSGSFSVVSNEYKDSYENVSIGSLSGTIKELSSYFDLSKYKDINGVIDNVFTGTGKETFAINGKDIQKTGEKGYYVLKSNGITKKGKGDIYNIDYIFVSQNPSAWKSAKDSKGRILNDKYFLKSSVQYNDAFQPMVELTFNDEGAKIFGELTKRLVGKQIAIFVGGEMLTAPNVNEPILNGKAVITGNYTSDEAVKLSQDINTGVVPAPIYLTSERTIDSRLGASSLEKLIISGLFGFLLIFLFLIYTYRLSGFMSSLALFFYVLVVLAIVKVFSIVLTLASIAGLILSVGMAIDANILVFERIREELALGHNFSKSIETGFNRSWSAIWDSHITGLVVAVILFIFGINMIKGFGQLLAIGIIMSLFTVMYVSKILILFASKKVKNQKIFIK